MKKKWMAAVLALAMSLSLAACGGGNAGGTTGGAGENASGGEEASGGSGGVLKIGVFEPQTGDNGAGGKQEILGMQYGNYVCPTVVSTARPTMSSWKSWTTGPRRRTAPLPRRNW